ncbi:hypothetical protein TeGR_g6527 [Tetraparma gracilis]|uniref:Flavodoxin-like domain-containing protein n=1 Tax=Tetraparma gracilis TaxID=2962635 RepID=A0ABQ6MD90_9STRA|nr:hypothetical protein TeGR_g6527 [Tetraparma gracilis]
MSRVLVVYGSETGQSKEAIHDIWDDINSTNYDYLLICTSSYGDGDAPGGYGKFLHKIQAAAKDSPAKLAGLQHSVLGCGSTAYDTYMNVPRLTDRALGKAGSRRCLKRHEADEMADDCGDGAKASWTKEIEAIFAKGDKKLLKQPPVCGWEEPGDTVYEKNMGPDGQEIGGEALTAESKLPALIAVAIAAAYYYFFVLNKAEEPEEGA